MSAFFARNVVRANFGHKRRVRLETTDVAFVGVVGAAVLLLGLQCTTEWLAAALDFQPALGTPAIDLRPLFFPIYEAWRSVSWIAALRTSESGAALIAGWKTGLLRSAVAAAFAMLLAVINRYKFRLNRVTESHGSARWAERRDIDRAGLFASDGVVLGTWEDHDAKRLRILRTNTSDHALLFMLTGAGKGIGAVLPTLLSCTSSAIVIDIKGENYAKTSGYRARELGQNVLFLDFSAELGETARYNFLDFVRFGTVQEEADIQRLASARVDPTGALRRGHSDGSHWLKTGIGLMAAAVLHTVYKAGVPKGAPCPVSLGDVLAELSDPTRTQEAMYKEWLRYAHDPGGRWEDAAGQPSHTHPIVAAVARIQLDRTEGERSSVWSTVVTALEVFRDPLLHAHTAASDFAIADIMDAERPTTLYIRVKPSDLDRLSPVANLFLDLTIRRLVEKMEFEGGEEKGTHKHPLLLVLDELPALGKVNIFAESLGYFRGWGIRAMVIVQSLMQLKELYGQYESISGMCGVAAAYATAPTDMETAKLLSSMVGTMTVTRRTPQGPAGSFGIAETEQEIARPLMTPDEIRTMPGAVRGPDGRTVIEAGHMLVIPLGCPAVQARQMLYFKDPVLLKRSRMSCAPVVPETFRARTRTAAAVAGASRSTQPTPSVNATPDEAQPHRENVTSVFGDDEPDDEPY